jgi:hypothetical protein
MKRFMFSAVVSAVGAAGLAITVAAQTPPSSAQTPSAKGSAPEQQVTLVGCVQREADYRKSRDAGKGGVAGTGVGAGNEFVLINASASKGSTPGATGTSGTASGSLASAYELTGSGEGQASQYVGKRVEVTGMLKAAETSASGRPTGGATAGQPPSGVDVTSKDLKLRELEVSSIKESTGSCPSE